MWNNLFGATKPLTLVTVSQSAKLTAMLVDRPGDTSVIFYLHIGVSDEVVFDSMGSYILPPSGNAFIFLGTGLQLDDASVPATDTCKFQLQLAGPHTSCLAV